MAEYARGSAGAALRRLDGVTAAVFPSEPERAVYNNALLDRDLGRTERAAAVDAMEAAYNSAGVDSYAAWVHESDEGMRAELGSRGYGIDESTRAMGMSIEDVAVALPEVELGPLDWPEYLEYLQIVGAPAGLLSGADPSAFHMLAARLAGENVATAITFDHDGDCGVFNLSTVEAARRQRARHRAHRSSRPRCRRTWLFDRKPAVHRDGRAGLRRGRFPRPRPDPRIRQSDARCSRPSAHGRADRRLATVTEILRVSGSLRAESANSAGLRTAAALAGDGIRTTLYWQAHGSDTRTIRNPCGSSKVSR